MFTPFVQLVLGLLAIVQPAMYSGPRSFIGFQPTSQPATVPKTAAETRKPRPSRSPVDEQLVKRLLGGQTSVVDAVEETLSRMKEASEDLSDRLDTGGQTQGVQKEIIAGIDKLIEEAAKNRAASRDRSSTVRRKQSKPSGRPSAGASQKAASQGKTPPPSSQPADMPQNAKTRDRGKGDADKADLSRGWGFLPQRDRDEISQGFDEQFPSKYRDRILEYYRTLAEEGRRDEK